MIFDQNLTQNDPGPDFRGNSGLAQKMASRLDETQNCASRIDETTGFDRCVPSLREGRLRHDWPGPISR